jgi:hypothetical protein
VSLRRGRRPADAIVTTAAAAPSGGGGIMLRIRGFLVARRIRSVLSRPGTATTAAAAGLAVGIVVGLVLAAVLLSSMNFDSQE